MQKPTNKKVIIGVWAAFIIMVVGCQTNKPEKIVDIGHLKELFFTVFRNGVAVDQQAGVLRDFIVTLESESKIGVTFVNSLAGSSNTLGYFVFSADVPEADGYFDLKKSDLIEEKTILRYAKSRREGSYYEIGPFSKNQKVGFFVESPNGRFYSVRILNSDKRSHTVKYREKIGDEYIVSVGFEDMPVDRSDKDYNDMLFCVSVLGDSLPHIPQIEVPDSERGKTERKFNVISFRDIVFYPDLDTFKESAYGVLDETARTLLANTNVVIEISGHTNTIGLPQNEMKLSVERAKRVMEYLAAKGVAGNKMRIVGSGGLRLKETGIAEANRRVEIRIIEYLK